MRNNVWVSLIAAFLLLPPALAQPAKHVILASIDGFAAYHLYNQELRLPNIRELIDKGTWIASSETVFPSVTHPAHTTIVTRVEPRLHGVIGNSMVNRRTGERFHPTNKPRKQIVRVPTIFDAAKRKQPTTAASFWPAGDAVLAEAAAYTIPEVQARRRTAIRAQSTTPSGTCSRPTAPDHD